MKHNTEKFSKMIILVFIITIISKCLGFLRDAIVAAYYGSTSLTDAFFFANSMPSLIFPTLCTAFSTAFMSLYGVKSTKETEMNAKEYASRMVLFVFAISVALTICGIVLSPVLVKVLAPGFSEDILVLAVKFTRILLPTFALNMLVYMFNAILDTHKQHVVPQSIGLISNIVIILSVVFLEHKLEIYALVYAQLVAIFMQVLFLVLFVYRYLGRVNLKRGWLDDVAQLLVLVVPIIIGNSLGQINQIVDKVIASYFPQGSMSNINYANTICNLVYAVLIVPTLSIVYPRLTEKSALKQYEEAHRLIHYFFVAMIVIVIPIMLIFSTFSNEIVTIIYGRGRFDKEAVSATAELLGIYAWGFVGFGIREVLTKMFYANQDTKTPMKTSSISIIVNIVLSIFMALTLGIKGIAYATVISIYTGVVLIGIRYVKKYRIGMGRNSLLELIKVAISVIITMAFAFWISSQLMLENDIIKLGVGSVLIIMTYEGLLLCLKYEFLINILKKVCAKKRNHPDD